MFLINIVKRCIVFVNWKRKTQQEGFETKRNLSCDSAEYVFSQVIKTPSQQYVFHYCCYLTKVFRTYIKYVQIDSLN